MRNWTGLEQLMADNHNPTLTPGTAHARLIKQLRHDPSECCPIESRG